MKRLSMFLRAPSLALALLVTVAGVGCGGGWQVVKTKNFHVYTDTEVIWKDVLRQLENGRVALETSFFQGAPESGPVEVLFLDDVPFTQYFGQWRSGASLAGTTTKIGKNGLLVLRPMAMTRASEGAIADINPDVAGRQGTAGAPSGLSDRRSAEGNVAGRTAVEMLAHLYIERTIPNAPLWFHEGFASWVRTLQYVEGGGKRLACFGYTPYSLTAQNQPDAIMPSMEAFWTANWKQYSSELRRWYPYTGTLLFDTMIMGDGGSSRHQLGNFVTAVAAAKPASEAMKATFGWSDADAYAKIQQQSQKVEIENRSGGQVRGPCPLPYLIPGDLVPDTGEPQVLDADENDIKALLAFIEGLPERDGYAPYFPLDAMSGDKKKR